MTLRTADLEQALLQLQQQPEQIEFWAEALTHTALSGDEKATAALLLLMEQQRRDRIHAVAAMAAHLAALGRDDSLTILAKTMPPPYAALCRAILAQYRYLSDYDPDQAYALYDTTLRHFPFADPLHGFSLAEIGSLKTQLAHRVLAPLLGVEPLRFLQTAPTAEDPVHIPPLPEGELLVLAACDEAYAGLYVPQFLAAVTHALPQATLLVHVMNPSPDGQQQRAALRNTYPRAVFSDEICPVNIPFYTVRRFTLAETLRHRCWSSDILVLDIDEEPTPALAGLVAAVQASPVALWQTKVFDRTVSGIYERVLFLRRNSPVTDRFLDYTRRYLHHKQQQGQIFWGWDGFALFHALCGLGEQRQQVLDLNPLYPTLFAEIMLQVIRHPKTEQNSSLTSPAMQELFRRLLSTRFDPAVSPQPFAWFLHKP